MSKFAVCAGALLTLGWSLSGGAFEVVIQGKRLVPTEEGQTCIEIAGDYPGVRIEASEVGEVPQVCYSDAKRDIISIHNVTFVALASPEAAAASPTPAAETRPLVDGDEKEGDKPAPLLPEVVIEFQHTFPPGPNGRIMARAKIGGFFATASGIGVATGSRLHYEGRFIQDGGEDVIAEPFEFTVGETMDAAVFENRAKERYLIAGPRTLKARLSFQFAAAGQKLTLSPRASVSIDTGSRFEDKLEEMEEGVEVPGAESAPQEAPQEEVPLDLEEELNL